MTESDLDQNSLSPDRDPAELRERVRAMIRQELTFFHPTEDARQPLELIVESSLRYSERDGLLKITALDESGKPCENDENLGAEATIRGILEGIRRTRPALFRQTPDQEDTLPGAPDASPVERDWLSVVSPKAAVPRYSERIHSARLGWQQANAWFHRQKPRWSRTAAQQAERLRMLGARWPDMVRSVSRRLPTDGPWRRRPVVLGALAAAALLAIGAYAALRNGERNDHPSGPALTGSVPEMNGAAGTPLRGLPEVIDTSTLSLQGRVIHLFGVEWASGGGKPDDLSRYLAGREVSCQPVAGTNTHRCTVEGKDLSTVVLYNGGGRATSQATEDLKAAAEHARQARTGVWSR
ncbi:thermonuclease family protein [Microvirga puerhi]|uniref:Nuclease n=1 Tax=Microvirga puerhi TaxID=2876078 RepID=A0ABS7VPQ6_9HYPH|nr:hypothetical protein [Microvirga puerhi]MBZ6077538.1 hypothetical protein [Microvirga puerhi]